MICILYLPINFNNSGYGMSIFAMITCGCFTLFSMLNLLEVKKQTGIKSFSKMGEKLLGRCGMHMVSFLLALCQAGYVCPYVFFIDHNITAFFWHGLNIQVPQWIIHISLFVLLSVLSYVRKIEWFAKTNIIADALIMVTLIASISYGIENMS